MLGRRVPLLETIGNDLRTCRERGASFDSAWAEVVGALRGVGAREWREVLNATRAGWRAAYELRPPVRAELALVAFLQDDRVPLAELGDDADSIQVARDLRRTANLSQQAMADAIGVSVTTLSRWERGEKQPSQEERQRYADQLRELAASAVRVPG